MHPSAQPFNLVRVRSFDSFELVTLGAPLTFSSHAPMIHVVTTIGWIIVISDRDTMIKVARHCFQYSKQKTFLLASADDN